MLESDAEKYLGEIQMELKDYFKMLSKVPTDLSKS